MYFLQKYTRTVFFSFFIFLRAQLAFHCSVHKTKKFRHIFATSCQLIITTRFAIPSSPANSKACTQVVVFSRKHSYPNLYSRLPLASVCAGVSYGRVYNVSNFGRLARLILACKNRNQILEGLHYTLMKTELLL